MLVGSLVVVAIGGIIELVPTFLIQSNVPTIAAVKPYTPLELHGRDIYLREGCYTCHSQMIRPFRDEIARYGEYSKAGEFVYDHPFQWGSKRTGPDLARIGGKYPDSWHYNHMLESQSISPGSIMPNYPWLLDDTIDTTLTPKMIRAMTALGVPYEEGYDLKANDDLMIQGNAIVANLEKDKLQSIPTSEIVALIAYLQRMGTDIKNQVPEALPAKE
jgi:cytochrome c oxidase cbb3-type subunit I/II